MSSRAESRPLVGGADGEASDDEAVALVDSSGSDAECDLLCEDDSDDPFLVWSQVLREERENIADSFAGRGVDPTQRVPFSLAFSGGGVRAAAFQAGILWRLAEKGNLKDIDYFTAVSGGGYIASAYASQVAAAGRPPSNDHATMDRWYQKIVADTLVRMQTNAGNFVRDSYASWMPDGTWERSGFIGFLPRSCDCLVLIVVLIITILVNPIAFLILLLVPTVEFVELFFGSAMRAAVCTFEESQVKQALQDYSVFGALEWAILVMLIVSLVVFMATKICPLLKPGDHNPETGFNHATLPYMVGYGLRGFLPRVTAIMFFLAILIAAATILERLKFCISEALQEGDEESFLLRKCNEWVGIPAAGIPGAHEEYGQCSVWNQDAWYTKDRFINQTLENGEVCDTNWLETPGLIFSILRGILEAFGEDLLGALTIIILAFFLISILLLPLIPGLMSRCIALLGPFLLFALMLEFTQWRVYGEMLDDKLFGGIPFDLDGWAIFVFISSILAAILIVTYSEVRAIQHIYYRRCLQNNFLANGRDVKLQELANPYCPLLVLTGTVSDYVCPGDNTEHKTISEISFTQLHEGSRKTGYTRTPEYETLGKAMALSGAGCLDAISLSLSHQGRMRFWTEALNLTWGDYILFHDRSWDVTKNAAQVGGRWEGEVLWLFRRMPVMNLLVVAYICIGVAAILSTLGDKESGTCTTMKALWLIALAILLFALFGSFFTFFFQAVAFSPIIRSFHQLTAYYYTGNHAPPMLYVTDGGAVDCVTLLQLVMRKCKRILLVLANADPKDDLNVVKTAVNQIIDMKLASFFDPSDPRSDIKVLFDRFKEDQEMRYLQIGIVYGWSGNGEREYGNLIMVKNRLRPSLAGMPVPPLMTAEEIQGLPPSQEDIGIDDERWSNLTQEQLGGLCCCDCCHLIGCNCGQKFPHLTGANYLYLTPQLFNCLARLGYKESGPAIDALVGDIPQLPSGSRMPRR
mmetsp:Transcript_67967/g.163157  ORF Transcript_67967/g.163157 Transcript_67967/m.163157 type:complete len:978 (-) Transcript_67967:207-3140(-)